MYTHMQKGDCPPLNDRDFYRLMTTDSKGNIDYDMVDLTLRYYPELQPYAFEQAEQQRLQAA